MELARCTALDVLDAEDLDFDEEGGYARAEDEESPENGVAVGAERRRGSLRRPASARELFAIHGEATGTSRSGTARKAAVMKKRRPTSATSTSSSRKAHGGSNQISHASVTGVDTSEGRHQEEIQLLRDQLDQLRQELDHAREERDEVQVAFRRLDEEIGNGYNLTERKEKELRIGELVTKNQRLSQMLEKELATQEALRASKNDLEGQVRSLQEQATLVNQVLSSVESKYIALVHTNDQLTANHVAVQERVAALQDELTQSQSRAIDAQRNVDYEEKLRLWESKYCELQRKLDGKNALLRAEQEQVTALERTLEKALEEKSGLVGEVASVHDQLIKMQGVMKGLEAKVEANAPREERDYMDEKLKQRVRLLEEELVSKNRLIADLKESLDGVISYDTLGGMPLKGARHRAASSEGRAGMMANRLVALTQRLRNAEESRDHKSRCLDVLLAALPPLLQQLDALQDKFHAAVESNSILSNAVEQLQAPEHDHELLRQPAVALARERYILSGPYSPELLMGYTLSRAFSEVAGPPATRKHTKFMPFQVRTMARTSTSEATNSQGTPQTVLTADGDDPSGAAFLNRSKINAFLHFLQGKAAKAKATPLLMQKIADLLSTQRELLHQHSTESGYYKAVVARLDGEVQQLKRKLQHSQSERDHALSRVSERRGALPNKLLLKLIEVLTGSPHRTTGRQHTFVTQHEDDGSSDVLILDGRANALNAVALDLADCNVSDEDLEPLLLKLSVCGLRICELDLADNQISDEGAATLAAFLETSSLDLRVLNLRGNEQITPDGVARLRTALMRNQRVHRVDVDEHRHVLDAIAAEYEFDTAGRPLVLLQVRLPPQAFTLYATDRRQDESVETMVQRLDTMGFCDTMVNLSRAEAVYRQPQKLVNSSTRRSMTRHSKSMTRTHTVSTAAKAKSSRPQQTQQEKKFRALEDAIRRAEETSSRVSKRASDTRGISITQMQHLLQHPHGSASSSSLSSHCVSKLQFTQSHLSMVRRLGRKNQTKQ